jgi:hypothetical protein
MSYMIPLIKQRIPVSPFNTAEPPPLVFQLEQHTKILLPHRVSLSLLLSPALLGPRGYQFVSRIDF